MHRAWLLVSVALAAHVAFGNVVVGCDPVCAPVGTTIGQRWAVYKAKFSHLVPEMLSWSATDDARHMATYERALADIELINSHELSARLGETQFTWMTREEFMMQTQGTIAPRPARPQIMAAGEGLQLNSRSAMAAAVVAAADKNNVLPAQPLTFDWRNSSIPNVVTGVGSQGSCGSCYAVAASASLYSCLHIAGQSSLTILSTQQIVDCSDSYGNDGCGGGQPSQAFNYIAGNGGLATSAIYPYVGVNQACNKQEQKQHSGKIKSYVTLAANDPNAMYAAVIINPIVVQLDSSSTLFQNYLGGIITNATLCGSAINHNLILIGYNYDPPSGLYYWIGKNSWGTAWGDAGYVYFLMSTTDGDPGVCGINTWSIYPTC
jgi:cathepsin L